MRNVNISFSWQYEPLFDPATPARYFILTGGRGSGKSFAVATHQGLELINDPTAQNILYLRKTLVSAGISIIPEFMEKLELLGYRNRVRATKGEIENIRSGSKIFFRGIQSSSGSNEANLKSIPNIGTVIIDEAQELDDEAAFDRIDLSLRSKNIRNRVILSLNPTDGQHWIYRRFFEQRGVADNFNGIVGGTCYIHTDYRDNMANLSDDFIQLAHECRDSDLEKYRHIFLGHWRLDNANALWKRATMIEPFRANPAPGDLDRVVVAIDPAVTSKEGSDLTGIVAAGRKRIAGRVHYFILGDYSLQGSPREWATLAIRKYRELDADRVVAEVNQGGDMVEQTIRNIDRNVSYRAVRATRGKIVRAEPIAALYEQGLVHHVGNLPALEAEMCSYCGYDNEKSPDRMDAMVWAMSELSGNGMGGTLILADGTVVGSG